MEAHASDPVGLHNPRVSVNVAASTIVRVGVIAGIAAGAMMAMWQMIVGAVATEPTVVPGIDSSFWTAVTAIPSVLFGQQWFHGSFEFWAVSFGLMGHMMNSALLGVVGVSIATRLLGRRPHVLAAMGFGVLFGILLELVIVNLIVNQVQDVNTLYTSTPEWSWWVAHALFGATLGAIAATLLRRET